MSLPSFNFLYIKAGEGKTGTTGDQLEAMWTTNFNLVKSLLTSLDSDVQKRIISNEIKQIKVEDNIAYFTTDDENWVSLGPSFRNLAGDPDDNEALVKKFSNYVTLVNFQNLGNRVSALEADVVLIDNTMTILDSDVRLLKEQVQNPSTGALARLTTLETDMHNKITSTSVIEIREHTEGQLQYTIDGENWFGVSESNAVEWGNILGDIKNQSDLSLLFSNVDDRLESLEGDSTRFNSHITDYDNPHAVSKAQLGLDLVDNTSDMNKPVSEPQKKYIDSIATVFAVTSEEYNSLQPKPENGEEEENAKYLNENAIYVITDVTQ